MRHIALLCIVFFVVFLVAPVFAQDVADEVAAVEEEIGLIADADEGVITGDVISVDIVAGSVTVKTDDGKERTFSVVDGETILWKGIEDIELSDVEAGEEAEVGYYTDESGKVVASWVDVLIAEDVAPLEVDVGAEEEVTGE